MLRISIVVPIAKTMSGSFPVNVNIRKTVAGSIPVNANIATTVGGSFHVGLEVVSRHDNVSAIVKRSNGGV